MRAGATFGAWLAPMLALAPSFGWAQAPDAGDAALDARIRASAAAAQGFQGPLDGAWTLAAASGQPLFAFQLVDRAGGRDPLEGVWRDLRHPAAIGDVAAIDTLTRTPDSLTIGFAETPGAPPAQVQLKLGADGGWTGELRDGAGATAVVMRRN